MTYLSSVESRAHVTHASTDKITKYYRTFLSVVAAICKILPCYLVRASRASAIPRVHDARSDGVRPLVISCSSQNPSPLWSARRNPLFSLGLERERCGYRPRPLIFAYNGTTCVAWTCKLRWRVYCIGIMLLLRLAMIQTEPVMTRKKSRRAPEVHSALGLAPRHSPCYENYTHRLLEKFVQRSHQ